MPHKGIIRAERCPAERGCNGCAVGAMQHYSHGHDCSCALRHDVTENLADGTVVNWRKVLVQDSDVANDCGELAC